ncbi:pimeloyl-ACP methyl ester carboxylesterase [Curtobacterium flaccumfaciens]|uniref:Pimeloyl-ACP methyl ester carboxylesterase n=2 Tax=Curtobacterium flaccumfaciens TaxID=2035 RepID=A0A4R6DF01_9MICO|nr:pimeloyl-ACP methyl ester carboxylesterase [Curtobacterium flaccumfaciens]
MATTTWTSDTGGDGVPLLLLHPGGTDSRSMGMLADAFAERRVVLVDRPGHGRTADVPGPWHFADAAAVVAGAVEGLGAGPVDVLGWSDGAVVGLHLALDRPDLVRSLVFGGAPHAVDGWYPGVLEGEPPQFMADAYAEVSPDGADHWAIVTAKARTLHESEPDVRTARLHDLRMPVLILCGDDDEVRLDHLAAMLEALPDGELAVVPRATHGLIVEKPALVADLVRGFHAAEKSDGVAPRRRGRHHTV